MSGKVAKSGSSHGDNTQMVCSNAKKRDGFEGGVRPTKGPGASGTGKSHGDNVMCRAPRPSDSLPEKQKPLDRLLSLLQRLLGALRPQKPQAGGSAFGTAVESELPGGRVRPTMFGSSHSDNVSKGPVASGNA